MKSIKYILTISIIATLGIHRTLGCGIDNIEEPSLLRMFRSCSQKLAQQWQEGCRFQDYEKDENCILWQQITSPTIPVRDIEAIVYTMRLDQIKELSSGHLPSSPNKFATWLTQPKHREDLDYILIAKEIEEIREYMNDPWYYPYEDDEEHRRLNDLMNKCSAYKGTRHAERYALQRVRLCFARRDYQECIDLWEKTVEQMPQNIVTNMIASYVGGAYSRKGNRDKAIELFTRSQDIGSLISLKAWAESEEQSEYADSRTKELEYIFNRFPSSPLLSVKLQKYIRDREDYIFNRIKWQDPQNADKEYFYNELKKFIHHTVVSPQCKQKGMWYYALAFSYYLDGDRDKALLYLSDAEKSEATPFIKESIRAFRFLMDASKTNNYQAYRNKLFQEIKWLDEKMQEDIETESPFHEYWQNDNRINLSFYYWQDVARKVLLGEVCPLVEQQKDTVLAIQLANYASNRIYQLKPLYISYCYDNDTDESYISSTSFDEYRKNRYVFNDFDFSNQFFEWINGASADKAALYAKRITQPESDLDRFLNERSYIDKDYICDIVGTLYLREMNYYKATEWLAKVSKDYQALTNVSKSGYFKLDPFRYQFEKKHFIDETSEYKFRFAQEMLKLENMITSDIDQNKKANAKIRYAIGLRNSFGKCWYLTGYGYTYEFESGNDWRHWKWFSSDYREGFKNNPFAQKAYRKVDSLVIEAISEFTDPEQAAQAQLEMMNFKTVIHQYASSRTASFVRGHCDSYRDYALQKR